jgi:Cu/Ag efflux protein CusF
MPVNGSNPKPRALCVGLVAFGLYAIGGCEQKKQKAAAEYGPAEHTYTVRGEVVEMPVAGDPMTSFRVKHEPIREYTDKDGKVVGMGTMTMSFTPGPGVLLEGIETGDKVEMVWEVWYRPRMRERVTAIRELPADTAMNYGR